MTLEQKLKSPLYFILIRYKKYRVRCVNCWHIPRKEGNSNSCCLKCGNLVRLISAQRKHTV